MRAKWQALVVVVSGCLAVPQLAAGDDVQEQLQQMQERLTQLEDQLTETSVQLEVSTQKVERQQVMMEEAGLGEGRSAMSGLSSFIEQVEIGGWVATSYFFNTNDPDSGEGDFANTGTFGGANPFHPDHNSFELDQVWFEMFKPASEESRGGFGIEIVYGKTADALRSADSTNGDLPVVYQGYVEWLAPIGPGLNIKAGRFSTLIGAEVAQTVYNFNITRGLVYSLLQPINHVGGLASMELDNGIDFAVGIANTAVGNANTDTDDDKAFLWRVGYTADVFSVGVNGLYGGDSIIGDGGGSGRKNDKTGIVDLVATWDPSESLSTWFNFDYLWQKNSNDGSGTQVDAWGMAVAGRYAITEQTGFAIRGEYVRSNDAYIFGGGSGAAPPAFNPLGGAADGFDQDLWSITGTVDHLLTENLTLRAEVRYEEGHADSGVSDKIFYIDGDGDDVTDSQVLLGVEMYYRF